MNCSSTVLGCSERIRLHLVGRSLRHIGVCLAQGISRHHPAIFQEVPWWFLRPRPHEKLVIRDQLSVDKRPVASHNSDSS